MQDKTGGKQTLAADAKKCRPMQKAVIGSAKLKLCIAGKGADKAQRRGAEGSVLHLYLGDSGLGRFLSGWSVNGVEFVCLTSDTQHNVYSQGWM